MRQRFSPETIRKASRIVRARIAELDTPLSGPPFSDMLGAIAIARRAPWLGNKRKELMLQFHVVISLVAMIAGVGLLYRLLAGGPIKTVTAAFLVTMILTDLTGFPVAPFGFDPPRAVGIISLLLLAGAAVAFYVFRLVGAWRWIFCATAVAAFYLDVFVGVVQSFQKLPFLQALAPTQSEPPFIVAQVIVLLAFVALGVAAVLKYRPTASALT
jgi:hypothetical protein